MSFSWLVITGIVLTLGACLQAAVGFGAGVFAISVLVWLGLPLPAAVVATLPIIFVQTALGCWQNRSELPWQTARRFFFLRLVTLPVGVWMMARIGTANHTLAKQVIGSALLLILLSQLANRHALRWNYPSASVVIPMASGLLAGLAGMGGPILMLWVMAQDWSPARQRSFLWLNILLIVPVQILIMTQLVGTGVFPALLVGLTLSPVGILGATIGNWVSRKWSRGKLRFSMTSVLFFIAIHSILSPIFSNPSAEDRRQEPMIKQGSAP